jgi:alpha-D-xyloside xylohydrolase
MGTYSLHKGLVIQKITVLGLHGAGRDLAIQVDGSDAAAIASSSPYFVGADGEKEAVEGGQRSLTMEVGGLELPLGKSFTMTWNMHIEA